MHNVRDCDVVPPPDAGGVELKVRYSRIRGWIFLSSFSLVFLIYRPGRSDQNLFFTLFPDLP
mgnify:CR=1 FL=1